MSGIPFADHRFVIARLLAVSLIFASTSVVAEDQHMPSEQISDALKAALSATNPILLFMNAFVAVPSKAQADASFVYHPHLPFAYQIRIDGYSVYDVLPGGRTRLTRTFRNPSEKTSDFSAMIIHPKGHRAYVIANRKIDGEEKVVPNVYSPTVDSQNGKLIFSETEFHPAPSRAAGMAMDREGQNLYVMGENTSYALFDVNIAGDLTLRSYEEPSPSVAKGDRAAGLILSPEHHLGLIFFDSNSEIKVQLVLVEQRSRKLQISGVPHRLPKLPLRVRFENRRVLFNDGEQEFAFTIDSKHEGLISEGPEKVLH